MPVSLYDLTVSSYLQVLEGVTSCLDQGLVHCRETGVDPDMIVGATLSPDMLSFNFQVQAITHHSVGALAAVKGGSYYAALEVPERSYVELQDMILGAQDSLRTIDPKELNGREGADVTFRYADISIPYTAENFLLSFAMPNFYFHSTTTYSILRMKGVPIGKRNYLGQTRVKN